MQVLDQISKLLREVANTEILPRFLRVTHTRKVDGSLLTEADLASQTALATQLPKIMPYPVLGEEMSQDEQSALWAKNQDGLWVVDPIDGTTNFIHGLPHFAISIAFMRDGKSILGIVYNPITQELFCASKGNGATLNGSLLPLIHTPSMLANSIVGLDLKYLQSSKLSSQLSKSPPFSSMRSMGASTLDWCYLAAGRFDLYLHGGQRLWDYAAGALILEEAGGKLATLESDDFWNDGLWVRSVVAARNNKLYQPWLRWIRENQ